MTGSKRQNQETCLRKRTRGAWRMVTGGERKRVSRELLARELSLANLWEREAEGLGEGWWHMVGRQRTLYFDFVERELALGFKSSLRSLLDRGGKAH